jgi:predicted RNase H-like HicB family nuclease
MPQFPAVIFVDPIGGIAVTFPDLSGCVAFARSMEEAPEVATRTLRDHVQAMRTAGEPIPEPTPLRAVLADARHAGGGVILLPGIGAWPPSSIKVSSEGRPEPSA